MTWKEFFKKRSPMWKAYMCFLVGELIAGITGLQPWWTIVSSIGYVGLFAIICRLFEASDGHDQR